ncbi:hypothetical protein [Sphingopyxis panaciterrae]
MALIAANRVHRDGRPSSNFDLPRYYEKRIDEYRARRGRGLGVGPAPMADRDGRPRADPSTLRQGNAYPVFLGDTLVAELLVNRALAMTEAERTSCALDGIVERLTDIHEALWVIGHDIYQALDLDEEKLAKLAADLPRPAFDEGQAVHLRSFRSQSEEGITHSYVEQFSVGAFHYSNIEDARAALRRQHRSTTTSGRQANDV